MVRVEYYAGQVSFEEIVEDVRELFSNEDVIVSAKVVSDDRYAILLSNSDVGETLLTLRYGCCKGVSCESIS